ncbi:MAG: PHP domain-containing protein [Actinomycetota bacterium]
MRIDLHTHSVASDGTEPAAEVMSSAVSAGLDVVALTDHDTTAGWELAAAAAKQYEIALVRGIEISCQHGGISIHLLGYLHDPASPGLVRELERSRESRMTRARRIVALISRDLPLDWGDVLGQIEPGATIGRPHIADAMVAKGIVPSRDVAFRDYLFNGSPYYASHYAPDAEQAVRLVVEAGGVAVMAHPLARLRGRVVDDRVIEAMASAGMAGLEVHHRDHDPEQVRHGLELAASLDLFVTGSSDYHGAGKVNRLGENLTDPAVLARIEDLATGVKVLRP